VFELLLIQNLNRVGTLRVYAVVFIERNQKVKKSRESLPVVAAAGREPTGASRADFTGRLAPYRSPNGFRRSAAGSFTALYGGR
jgi:hypothetical protein